MIRQPWEVRSTANLENLRERVRREDVGGTVRDIVPLQNGFILVRCVNEAQRELMRGAMVRSMGLKVAEQKIPMPSLVLTGVQGGYRNEELIGELLGCNPGIIDTFGPDVR